MIVGLQHKLERAVAVLCSETHFCIQVQNASELIQKFVVKRNFSYQHLLAV